jgi:FkbM family methyltransferase
MLHWAERPSKLRSFTFNGHPFFYRSGTADVSALNEVLFRKGKKSEYYFPLDEDPKVILDIGGHIGDSAIYYALKYPKARIYTVEPIPANFEILKKNIAPYPNIRAFNFGLGHENGSFPVYALDGNPYNTGGYSLISEGGRLDMEARIRRVSEFLAENSLDSVDLIKIDTEGAEYDILTAFPDEALKRVKWIIGELHDHKDFDLLAHLARWFHIGLNKEKIRFRYSIFRAVNRNLPG